VRIEFLFTRFRLEFVIKILNRAPGLASRTIITSTPAASIGSILTEYANDGLRDIPAG
jgi:hypothetical protein